MPRYTYIVLLMTASQRVPVVTKAASMREFMHEGFTAAGSGAVWVCELARAPCDDAAGVGARTDAAHAEHLVAIPAAFVMLFADLCRVCIAAYLDLCALLYDTFPHALILNRSSRLPAFSDIG
jgi:hypothetical protein